MNSTDRFGLEGKVAIVTGAGRGLGAEIALSFASAGAAVVVTDIDPSSAKAQAEHLAQQGYQALDLQHDVVDETQWCEVIAKTVEHFGGYDILVNNAGIENVALFENLTIEDFQRVQNINVNGTFLGIKHSIRAMKPDGPAGKGGSIINLSSVAGMVGLSGMGAYCTAKGAIRLMTKAAAKECAELGYGIRVNSMHPALILTDLGIGLLQGFVDAGLAEDLPSAQQKFEAIHPMGFGKPEDVANLAQFLASPASSWVTGTENILDGGLQA